MSIKTCIVCKGTFEARGNVNTCSQKCWVDRDRDRERRYRMSLACREKEQRRRRSIAYVKQDQERKRSPVYLEWRRQYEQKRSRDPGIHERDVERKREWRRRKEDEQRAALRLIRDIQNMNAEVL